MNEDDANDVCRDAWRLIRNKTFHDWTGLPAACSYGDFDEAFERMGEEYGRNTLGSGKLRTRYRTYTADEYEEPLKVWFRDDDLVLIEISYPELPYPGTDLLDRLGEPDDRLDYELDVIEIEGGAWIYPPRGIALFLDAGKERVMRISLFRSCSPAEYAAEIRRDTSVREFPLE